MQVVDRPGELADLLVGGHVDRGDRVGLLAGADLRDGVGQGLVGDRERALAMLRRHGQQSIAHMTTWRGNTLLLNGAGDAYIAYRIIGGVALALGDPVGDEDGGSRAIEEFLDLCASRGWTPCFYATTNRFLPAFRDNDLDSLQIAEDTVIDLAGL